MKPKYLISACLVGQKTKYDGTNNYNDRVSQLYKDGGGILICPETMGGMDVPRNPCEIINNKVINDLGEDKTLEFINGARTSLEKAKEFGITKAILKSRSPSCGYKKIYDGSFTHKLVDGNGITTRLLLDNDFEIFTEEDMPLYDAIILCAGDSNRCNINYNKVFHYCCDHTVIEQAIEPFLLDYLCNEIIIVAKETEIKLFKALITSEKVKYVIGGSSREESALNGLKVSKANYALIHDGDRPYIDDLLIEKLLYELLNGKDNAIPYINSLDSTRDYVVDNKSIQTPQAFKKDVLLKSFEGKQLNKYRDESSLFENEINYVLGNELNKKITYYEDLKEFEGKNKK